MNSRFHLTHRIAGLFVSAVFGYASIAVGAAQTENVIHRFTRSTSDGGIPGAGFIADKSGNLYGTTVRSGAFDQGTVFELSPPTVSGGSWTQTILYSFTGGTDGASPQGQLTFDAAGNLFGTAFYGGNPDFGTGVVFELSPSTSGGSWTQTVLWAFDSGTGVDGSNPTSNLVFDTQGYLYGVTAEGGAGSIYCGEEGCGTVFQLRPPTTPGGPWTESDIYNFFSVGTTDGFGPTGILLGAGACCTGQPVTVAQTESVPSSS